MPEGEQVWMNLEEFLLIKQRFLENYRKRNWSLGLQSEE